MSEQKTTFSKSENVRVELKDAEYLKFAELNSRLVFSGKEVNERKSREETMKFALRVTSLAVKQLLVTQGDSLFIADDENALIEKIIRNAVGPYQDKEVKVGKLLNILVDINEKTSFTENEVTINQKDWNSIINLVSALKTF